MAILSLSSAVYFTMKSNFPLGSPKVPQVSTTPLSEGFVAVLLALFSFLVRRVFNSACPLVRARIVPLGVRHSELEVIEFLDRKPWLK